MKIGDVVRLKSGGPWMTVDDISDFIHCRWIGENGHYQMDAFHAAMLTPRRWWHA